MTKTIVDSESFVIVDIWENCSFPFSLFYNIYSPLLYSGLPSYNEMQQTKITMYAAIKNMEQYYYKR